ACRLQSVRRCPRQGFLPIFRLLTREAVGAVQPRLLVHLLDPARSLSHTEPPIRRQCQPSREIACVSTLHSIRPSFLRVRTESSLQRRSGSPVCEEGGIASMRVRLAERCSINSSRRPSRLVTNRPAEAMVQAASDGAGMVAAGLDCVPPFVTIAGCRNCL